MIVSIHLEDGSVIDTDVDFSSMTVEEIRPYADMAIPSALKAMKNLIGYDYLKSPKDFTIKDAEFYARWAKKNDPESYAAIKKTAAKIEKGNL
jgi:hypothetical protein